MLNTPGSLLWSQKTILLWNGLVDSSTEPGHREKPIATVPQGSPLFVVTSVEEYAFASWMFLLTEKSMGWAYLAPSYYIVLETTAHETLVSVDPRDIRCAHL